MGPMVEVSSTTGGELDVEGTRELKRMRSQ